MDALRWLAVDVGPYFGVFLILSLVIYWQMRMIITMIAITRTLDGHSDDDDDEGHGSGSPPP